MRRATAPRDNYEIRHPFFEEDGETETYCYVWGVVRYKDGLGQERHTKFCHRYNAEGIAQAGAINVPAERGRQHEFGNEAT